MLLYHTFVLDKIVLANAMGCSGVLSGISSHPELMLSLTCKRLAPRLILEVSVSRYKGFNAS